MFKTYWSKGYIQFGLGTLALGALGMMSLASVWSRSFREVRWENGRLERSEIEATFLDPTVENSNWKIARIEPQRLGRSPLWLVDFNTPKLCGRMGCLMSAYIREDKQYKLVSNLLVPKSGSEFDLTLDRERSQNGFPCLKLTVSHGTARNLRTYCFNGSYFVLVLNEFLGTEINFPSSSK